MEGFEQQLKDNENQQEQRYNGLSESMKHARNRLLFFVLFSVYCMLAIFGTTDKIIFMEQEMSMPLLGIELPLIAFYMSMPVIFLVLHFNLLYTYRTHKKLLLEEKSQHDMVLLKKLPFGLFESVLLEKNGNLGRLLYGVMMVLLYWLAPLTLMAFWFRFSDYQNWWMSTFHFGLLAASIFIPFQFFRGLVREEGARRFGIVNTSLFGIFLGMLIFYHLLVVVVVSLPTRFIINVMDEKPYVNYLQSIENILPELLVPQLVLKGEVLVQAEQNLLEMLREEKDWNGEKDKIEQEKRDKKEPLLHYLPPTDYSDRNFRLAKITDCQLPRVDLSGSAFQAANLQESTFQKANLEQANLQGASLLGVNFKGTYLCGIQEITEQSQYVHSAKWDNCKVIGFLMKTDVFAGQRISRSNLKEVKSSFSADGEEIGNLNSQQDLVLHFSRLFKEGESEIDSCYARKMRYGELLSWNNVELDECIDK